MCIVAQYVYCSAVSVLLRYFILSLHCILETRIELFNHYMYLITPVTCYFAD